MAGLNKGHEVSVPLQGPMVAGQQYLQSLPWHPASLSGPSAGGPPGGALLSL